MAISMSPVLFIGSHPRSSVEPRELVIGIDQFNDYYDPNLKRRNIAQFENHPAFKLVEGGCSVTGVHLVDVDVVYHQSLKQE